MKKIMSLVLVLVLALSLVAFAACEDPNPNPGPQGGGDVPYDQDVTGINFSGKVYVTSLGQFAITTATSLLDKAGVTYESDMVLEASDCEAGSTVVVVLGGSNKGLGAAGTDAAGEVARAQAFAVSGLNIVCMHTGQKSSGRGTLADPIIKEIAPSASVILVVNKEGSETGGDYDGLFTGYATNDNVPVYFYSGAAKMAGSIANIFAK